MTEDPGQWPRGSSPEATDASPRIGASTWWRLQGLSRLLPPACRREAARTRPIRPWRAGYCRLVPDPERDVDVLVRRLRGLSARAWATRGRRDVVRRLCADLVGLGEPGHVLPDLPDHALGDGVAVLSHEAIQTGRRDDVAAAVRRALEDTK